MSEVVVNEVYDLESLLQPESGEGTPPVIKIKQARAHLLGKKLQGVRMLQSFFDGLSIYDSSFAGCQFVFSEFHSPDFNGVTFTDCYFKGALFETALLRHVEFNRCVFDGCRFQFTSPVTAEDGVSLRDCLFVSPDFQRDELLSGREVAIEGCSFFADSLPERLRTGNFQASLAMEKPAESRPTERPSPAAPVLQAPPSEAPKSKSSNGSRFEGIEIT